MIRIDDFDNMSSLFFLSTEVEWLDWFIDADANRGWSPTALVVQKFPSEKGTAVVTVREKEDGDYEVAISGQLPTAVTGLPYEWNFGTKAEAINQYDRCVLVLREKPAALSTLTGRYA